MTVGRRSDANVDRAQVYAAERAAFGGTLHERRRPFHDLEQMVQGLVDDPWWPGPAIVLRRARSDARRSSAVHRAGGTARLAGSGATIEIRIAVGQHDEATLCHELAHVLAGVASGHDGRFRAAHVDLARTLLGETARSWLADAYERHGLALGDRDWPAPPRPSTPGLGPIAL